MLSPDLPARSNELSPLPPALRHGLTAVSIFALISFLCSLGLFAFLSYRILWTWRRRSTSKGTNQFLILIYNLLFADIQQSLAFLLNITALGNDAIQVNTPTCWAQGWFISTGDLSSSIFITGIAIHTLMSICWKYQMPTTYFYCCIGILWAFVYITTLIGICIHAHDPYYVRAGAWCWVNEQYSATRLWAHYFWIFTSMVLTLSIYAYIIWHLYCYGNLTQTPKASTRYATKITSSTRASVSTYLILLIYPTIYVICTMPLAVGRIVSMGGNNPSLGFFCLAGALISLNGSFDALLYSLTRRTIIFADASGPTSDTGVTTFTFLEGMGFGNETIIETGGRGRSSSTEELYLPSHNNNGIEIKETTTVKIEETSYGMEMRNVRDRGDGSRSLGGDSVTSEDGIVKKIT